MGKYKKSVVCFLVVIAFVMTGCTNKTDFRGTSPLKNFLDVDTKNDYEKILDEIYLTGVFKETSKFEFEIKETNTVFSIETTVTPFYNTERDEINFLVFPAEIDYCDHKNNNVQISEENQTITNNILSCKIVTASSNGDIISLHDINLPEDSWICKGEFWNDTLSILLGIRKDPNHIDYIIEKFSMLGEMLYSCHVNDMVGGSGNNILFDFCEDCCIISDGSIFTTLIENTGKLEQQNAFISEYKIIRVGVLPNKQKSYTCQSGDNIYMVYVYDEDAKELKEIFTLPDGAQPLDYVCENFLVFYWNKAYWGFDGRETFTIMKPANSSISNDLNLLLFIGDRYAIYENYSEEPCSLYLYEHVDDIDLSEVNYISIATTQKPDAHIEETIWRWNKMHPEQRVIITDVSNPNDRMAGGSKLAFNLANGFYKPDIILTSTNDVIIDTLLNKELYVDLQTYTQSDKDINDANMFTAIKDALTDYEGRMWGITPYFSLKTVFCLQKTWKSYGSKNDSWTITDYISFAEKLPSTHSMGRLISQDNYILYQGPSAFNSWIDYSKGECYFETETFYRYLSFVKSLPRTTESYLSKFQYTLLDFDDFGINNPLKTGEVALSYEVCGGIKAYISTEFRFGSWGTSELLCLGFPTTDGSKKSELFSDAVFVITSYCENPSAAWEIIKSFFYDENVYDASLLDDFNFMYRFPALKSSFCNLKSALDGAYIETSESNNTIYFKNSDNSDSSKSNRSFEIAPGYIDAVLNELENISVFPVIDITPRAISDIITEEITALTSGVGDEKTTAQKIQSRVSIWLSEHS